MDRWSAASFRGPAEDGPTQCQSDACQGSRPSSPPVKGARSAALIVYDMEVNVRKRVRSPVAVAVLLFTALAVVYELNGGPLPGNDAKPNAYLAVALLTHGELSFSPREEPFMFRWRMGRHPARVERMSAPVKALIADGRLRPVAGRYYVVPSVERGRWVSTFGPGAGIAALPVMAAATVVIGNLGAHPGALWIAAKLAAALAVAGSAAFVFLSLVPFTTRRRALLIAAAYGLGTCVWSMSSQSLWQHGPNELFLALGMFFATRIETKALSAYGCGLALSAAVACRPTSALVCAAVLVYLAIHNRAACARFVLASAPVAVLLGLYNWVFLGSPFRFGQLVLDAHLAVEKTGSPAVWQTPLWKGAAGLLISPSRGLVVYSPILVLGLAGVVMVWQGRGLAALRPFAAAVPLLFVVQFKFFDWWGGWSFGYRHLVDTAPLLAVLASPALDWTLARRWRSIVAGAALIWSIAVQCVGAFAYNVVGWNARRGADGRPMNIDRPAYRYRLWSLSDSQLVYYATHFTRARQRRLEFPRSRGQCAGLIMPPDAAGASTPFRRACGSRWQNAA